jgi:hypothetical protein
VTARGTETEAPAPSLNELRSRWRSEHICLGCGHHAVCKMASALDPSFLVVISQCLVFEPAEAGERGRR